MKVRCAELEDLKQIEAIYAKARAFMAQNGNPTQWGSHYPPKDLVRFEVEQKRLYVLEHDGNVHGVFAFYSGPDPDYAALKEGQWLSQSAYGVIHRVASDGCIRGVVSTAVQFCWQEIPHLRIDTHRDNAVMQHQILKNGFQFCGIIQRADGSERLVYEKIESE